MATKETRAVEAGGRTIEISSPDKVYFPELGATKFELVSYYLAVADALRVTATDRPALLERYPGGAGEKSFFQKRVPANAPDWLETTTVTTQNGTPSNALVIADIAHVLWAVNLGCLGLHLWPYRASDPDHADELRIDLDPQPGTTFDHVRVAATHVHALLDEISVLGFPKTTGNRGIHVYVRLAAQWNSFDVRAAAVALARELERRHPDLITANWWKEERGERVFVDFNQNAPHKTVFGAWFARPRVGGQVSTPLSWDEIDSVDPEQLTIRTVPGLLERRGDPWATIGDRPQSLEPLLEMAERDRAAGLRDAPWPPEYPKQPDEPTRVAPSRAKKEPDADRDTDSAASAPKKAGKPATGTAKTAKPAKTAKTAKTAKASRATGATAGPGSAAKQSAKTTARSRQQKKTAGEASAMNPTAALRQIAYLLERDGAETYKVRAFRKAAAAIAEIPADELAAMTPAGLQKIPDVGKTSAQVIAEAAAGKQPEYLAKLDSVEVPAMSDEAAELRALLQGDCHSHSDWSDGGSPIREMAESAKALGHRYWALTDHSPRLTVAHGLNEERLLQQLDVVAELNEELAPFRILTGIEVDILEDGSLDQDEELLARLDVVVASVHSKLRMDAPEMTKRMIRAIESPHTDILGHCTGRLIVGRGRPPSSFDADAVFSSCAHTGTAVEINSRPERLDPPDPLLELALSLDCVVTIDTDAHAPGQLDWQRNGCEKAAEVGVPTDRIMNALPLDDFLAWTASHAA